MEVSDERERSFPQELRDGDTRTPTWGDLLADSHQTTYVPRELAQTLIDAVPSGTIAIDRNYQVVLANRAARQMAGGIDPVSKRLRCYQLSHRRETPCEGPNDPCPLVKVWETKAPAKVTHTHFDAAGNPLIVEVTAVPILDDTGEVTQVVESCRDITEFRETQKALCESEERFELAVRAANAGIWDRDLRTGEVYYSPRWKGMIGYDEHEIDNSYDEWESRLHPDDREPALAAMRDYLEGNAEEYKVEFRLRHRDGSYRWILSHGTAVRDAAGNPARVVGSHIDITERKIAEMALRREKLLLGQLIELQERERKLVACEIHDALTQPLIGAMMQFEGKLTSLQGDYPEVSFDGCETAIHLLRDTIAASRQLMRGLRPTMLDDFGVVSAIETLIEDSRTDGAAAIEFVKRIQFDRLSPALETAIFRVVQESLRNAVRYSHSDRIRVTLTQHDETVHVEIEDWGTGFDPREISEDHFGLEGIRERASLLGGLAEIQSRPNRGTRISMDLPLVERS